ncbi:MAG: hypothetical protein MUF64_24050 [Polyangiaceae bacterium]|jgi:hypothetical protein|nr:hypothetical protein [Polyangiaceae bacterium]
MYRDAAQRPLCPACGSSNQTEETQFDPSEGYAQIFFRMKTPPRSSWDSDKVRFIVDRARICIDCGHVSLSLSESRRRELAAQLGGLKPMPS